MTAPTEPKGAREDERSVATFEEVVRWLSFKREDAMALRFVRTQQSALATARQERDAWQALQKEAASIAEDSAALMSRAVDEYESLRARIAELEREGKDAKASPRRQPVHRKRNKAKWPNQ